MKRKVKRNEVHETVVNLNDLGFTPTAITYMVQRTSPVVYFHLKSGGRMKGGKIVRKTPLEVTTGSLAAMRRLFPAPFNAAITLLALSRQAINGNGD